MDRTPTPRNFSSNIFKLGIVTDEQLDEIHCTGTSPSEKVIKNIMNYSRALSVMKSKRAGIFSMLLN